MILCKACISKYTPFELEISFGKIHSGNKKTGIIIMVIIIYFLPLNLYELNHEMSGSKKIDIS